MQGEYLAQVYYSDASGNWRFPWMGAGCPTQQDAMMQANDQGRILLRKGATMVKVSISFHGILVAHYYPNCVFEA